MFILLFFLWGVIMSKEEMENPTPEEEQVEEPTEEVVEEPQVEEQKKPETPISFSLDDERRSALRNILNVMKEMDFAEVTLHYNGNINIREMNPSRVAMIIGTVDLGAGLEATAENIRDLTVDIDTLLSALKVAKPSIDVNDAEAIFYGSVGSSSKKAKVTIPLLENPEEPIPEPKLTGDIETEIDLSEIQKALNILVEEPSYITLISEVDHLRVKATNDKAQKIELNGFTSKGEGKASFSYGYIKALGKRTWKIEYKTDMPMKATKILTQTSYGQGGIVKTPCGSITVWIAPRIED